MHGARDQLLAGARLAEDADRDVAASHAGDEGENLAHGRRVADEPVDDLALGHGHALVLLDDAAHTVMFGARAEECRQRIARFRRPAADAVDEEQLAIAADDPIGLASRCDDVELHVGERRKRPDLLPLPEPIARGETPGGGDEIAGAEWELADRRFAQETKLDR